MISTPDRASETDVRARSSRLASFKISYSALAGGAAAAAPSDCGDVFTMPQCPCDMYSQRQTSPITTTFRTSLLIARVAFCTMPSSAHAPVAISSFCSGQPEQDYRENSKTPAFADLLDRLVYREVEDARHRTHFFADVCPRANEQRVDQRFGVSRVSRTSARKVSVRRKRRRRLTGNAMGGF